MTRLTCHQNPPLSLYIHLPWCIKKCPYCDFNAHAFSPSNLDEDNYIEVLIRDLEFELPRIEGRAINTIFIGGGTPSLFSVAALAKLLSAIQSRLHMHPAIEITLEANPGTAEAEKFRGFREIGINRLSLGVQSFNDKHLKALGRIHDATDARRALTLAKDAGFLNFNIDLMFGLPAQTMNESLHDLEQVLAQEPTHISWYQLNIEPNTVFNSSPPTLPNDDDIWAMQERGQLLLEAHGFKQYEISAYAKGKFTALHNVNYWQFGDYLGIGAGAHSKITQVAENKIERVTRHKIPKRYIELAGTRAAVTSTKVLTDNELPLEFMMNALRLTAGIKTHLFFERTGLFLESVGKELNMAKDHGFIDWQTSILKPSAKGRQYLNELLEIFVR